MGRKDNEPRLDRKEKAEEYLAKAMNAQNLRGRIDNLKKALEMDPDNIEAELQLGLLLASPIERLKAVEKVEKKEEKKLSAENYFDEIDGDFWVVFETRPYMRILREKLELLHSLNRVSDSIALAEKMIKLNSYDNLGVRYLLMGMYALQEDMKKAKALLKKYGDEKSVGLLLPYAICCYRLGKYKECDKAMEEAMAANEHLLDVLYEVDETEYEGMEYYSPGEESEVIMAMKSSSELLSITPSFFEYLEKFDEE